MIKKETIDLLKKEDKNFENLFSVCIGKNYVIQDRFIDYIGEYNKWNTDVTIGKLLLDDRVFDVEYIGTTSNQDNYWYSSEIERVIPDNYVKLQIDSRKMMESVGINEFCSNRIELKENINGYNLSMIYIAFTSENVAYFKGSGNTSIYMYVKNLPRELFKKMNSMEFTNKVPRIISEFNVNHRLLVEAMLIENEIPYKWERNSLIAKFSESSIISVEFDQNKSLIKEVKGNISLE